MTTPGENIRRLRDDRGWTQTELAQKVGISQPSLAAIEKGETQRTKYLPQIAAAFGVPLRDIDPTLDLPFPGQPPVTNAIMGDKDFPIYASAEGGAGTIILSTDPVDFMPRPAPLSHVRTAYGLYLTGDSMVPEFWPGETAMVNPVLPIVSNVPAILYSERHGEARATIKRITGFTPDTWRLKQWNPPEGKAQDFRLPRIEWPVCHRVIGKYTA